MQTQKPSAQLPPRPCVMRPLFIPGIQYEGESDEQMAAREARARAALAYADAEEARLWAWKLRPWWIDSDSAPLCGHPSAARPPGL